MAQKSAFYLDCIQIQVGVREDRVLGSSALYRDSEEYTALKFFEESIRFAFLGGNRKNKIRKNDLGATILFS